MDKFFIYINHNEKYRENKKTFKCGVQTYIPFKNKTKKVEDFH